jgi:hypothetical protein
MSMLRVLRFVTVVFMVLMGSKVAFGESVDMPINGVISDIQHRFVGEGQIVVVVSAGSNRPENEMLFFTDAENQERINLNRTLQARWLSSDEIIVQQSYETISRTLGNRIIRVDRHGQLLEVLSDQEGAACPVPNKLGEWLAIKTDLKTGVMQGIEFHGLHEGSDFSSFMRIGQNVQLNPLSNIVWSPEFTKLALAAWVKSNRGYVPRIGVVSGAAEGIQMIDDDMSLNARPFFWKKEWIYGANDKGMFRCDAMKHGCEFIYAPGGGRRIVSGVSVGKDHVLLLVQNLRRDPFETRATEIHKVDFLEGKKLDVLELPEGVFISDIDWVSSPEE